MYDILIIGSGPGGYVAAIRAAQLGLRVGCIDKSEVGGTCLNVGCIPSKSLLDSSLKHYHLLNQFEDHGLHVDGLKLDLDKMMSRKQDVITQLTNGVGALLKSNKVDFISGIAKIKNRNEVEIFQDSKTEILKTQNIIIATGSNPIELENIKFDENIVDSEKALKFDRVPKQIVVIGAGVIGLELSSVWSRLGSNVTLLEAQNEFLPMLDKRISRQIFREFENQGLKILLDSKVLEAQQDSNEIEVTYSIKEEEFKLKAEKIIVAVGRKAHTEDLFEDDLIEIDNHGLITVDKFCQTSERNIWAIGDVVRGPMLAHKASEEGLMVVERILGKDTCLNYDHIPNVIYTHPEIAWVGLNEQQLKEKGKDYKVGSFPFLASGRALASGETAGSVQVVSDNDTDRILGIQVFGPSASEILQQGLIAMDNGVTSEGLSKTIFSHPTVSEALLEATLAMNGEAIHIQNRKKK